MSDLDKLEQMLGDLADKSALWITDHPYTTAAALAAGIVWLVYAWGTGNIKR